MSDTHSPDSSEPSGTSLDLSPSRTSSGNRVSVVISGLLIAAMAVGLGWQFVRARSPEEASAEKQRQEFGRTDILDQPAVRINGTVITREVLARECLEQFGQKVLESVINRTIIQQACEERGIQVTDSEVIAEVNRISKKVGLATDEWYRMIQAERGLTPYQYHRDVIWPLLALRKLAGEDVKITKEMMQEAYVDNYGPRVRARMIVVDNQRRGEELLRKLAEDPDQFEELARNYSVEPNSRALGGSIPPIRRYSGAHEEIRRAAFRMKKPGQISPLLQVGPRQYAILKYEGRTDPVEHDKEEVKAILYEELREREIQLQVAATFDKLKKQARIDNYLTGETTAPAIRRTAAADSDRVPFRFTEPELN